MAEVVAGSKAPPFTLEDAEGKSVDRGRGVSPDQIDMIVLTCGPDTLIEKVDHFD